jgi:tight adherence protein B
VTVLPPVLLAAAALVLLGLPAPSRLTALAGPVGVAPTGRPWLVQRLLPGLLLAAVAWWLGPAAVALGVLVAVGAGRAWPRHLAARERARERTGATEALAVLGAELRAGRSPADALAAASGVAGGPLAQALAAASSGSRFGADPARALLGSAELTAVPELVRGLAACLQVCGTTGSSLAAAVDRLAEALGAEHAQRLAVDAELAGPRATAGLLAVLPLAGIALAAGLGARPVHVLLHTPVGLGCLAGGLALDGLGLWWTGRLVAAAGGRR